MKKPISIYFILFLFSSGALKCFAEIPAQKQSHNSLNPQQYVLPDSSNYIRQNGILIPKVSELAPLDSRITFRDTIFYNPIFLPVVFDGRLLPANLDFLNYSDSITYSSTPIYHLVSPDSTLAPYVKKMEWNQRVRQNYYSNNPTSIRYNVFTFKGMKPIDDQAPQSPNEFRGKINGERSTLNTKINLQKYVPKTIYWTKNGEHSLQINQNQYSSNWYAGGNNSLSIINYQKITFNYKKDKISWNNTFEWKLNFQRTPADSVHKTSVNEDYVRIYSVAGIDASKKWSYTIKNEIKTPLFKNYKINSSTRTAALFSPLQINTGVGMTYNYSKTSTVDKNRKLTLSVDLSPVSINYNYVGDSEVDETNFGITSGKKAKLDFGSTYNINLTYSYNRNSTFTTRMKYFTSYSKVIAESENKFNFAFTRVLSSTIYAYLRYDDSVDSSKKDGSLGYFQYNELIGFGLSYKW